MDLGSGLLVVAVDGEGMHITDSRLNFIKKYTTPPLYSVGGNYVKNVRPALTSMVDSTGTTTYNRDALYRLTSVVTPDGLGGVKTVSYAYDAAGNRTSLTYPDAKQVSYAYDAADQMTGITDWSLGASSLSYDNAGRPTSLSLPNSTSQSFTYDAASRLTAIAYRGPAGAVIGDVGYGYDADSRRTSLTDSEGTTTFGYDALNRLTSAAYPNGTTSYLYDAVGNRTSTTTPGGTTSYTYDAADRLTQAGSTAYGYDANGNLTARGADTFSWDSADRLTSASVGGTSATMSYDGSHNLVAKTVGGATTGYVYDRNLPLPQLLTAGDTTYQYGPGMAAGFGPMMQEAGGTKSWLHDDALGSVRFTTNSSGTSIGSSTYDAFGSQRVTSGQQNLFRFAGQEQHEDLGLMHMGARWYDPQVGRLISRDAADGSAADPQSLNSYAYARNNPCNLRDLPGASGVAYGGSGASGGAGSAAAVHLGLRHALAATPLNRAVLTSAGGSTCFVGEAYKAIWYWKDAPTFHDPGGDLKTRLAAYWAWVDAIYRWSAEILSAWARGPTYTKVAGVGGCRPGRGGGGLLADRDNDEWQPGQIDFDSFGTGDRDRHRKGSDPTQSNLLLDVLDFLVLDDLRTLANPNADWRERVIASAALVPTGKLLQLGGKAVARAAGKGALQGLTWSANRRLASNPALARGVLKPAEYAAGQARSDVARMFYGHAVERMVANRLAGSSNTLPTEAQIFSEGGRSAA